MASFSIIESYKYGYNIFKANFKFFAEAVLILFLVSFLNLAILNVFELGVVFFGMLQLILLVGILRSALALIKEKEINLSYLFLNSELIINLFITAIAGLLIFLILLGSFIAMFYLINSINEFALLIPATVLVAIIYFKMRLLFIFHFLIEAEFNLITAIKKSFLITKEAEIKLFFYAISLAIFNLVGLIALFFGLILTIPVSCISSIYIYQQLSKKRGLI